MITWVKKSKGINIKWETIGMFIHINSRIDSKWKKDKMLCLIPPFIYIFL